MKKIYTSICLFIFLISHCIAQSDFRNGYVISNNNDTIFGLINLGNKRENSLKCTFIKDSKSERTIFYPKDIKGYRITDSKYYIAMSPGENDTETVFLEYLINGIVDLYYYENNIGDHYFISKDGTNLTELKKETINSIVNGQSYEREYKEFIGVLKTFFTDSPTIMNKVDNLSLSHNSLIQIAEDYHMEVCPEELCTSYSKKKTKIELSYGSVIGLTFSEISLFEHAAPWGRIGKFPNSKAITLGGFFNISDQFISKRLSLQLEILFSKIHFSNEISNLDIATLKIPLLFKYNFPFKKVQSCPFIGFGYNNILLLDYNSIQYGALDFLSGRDQYSLFAGFETSFKLNTKWSAILQVRYEHITGYHHIGEWDDMGQNTLNRSMFFSYFNNISLITGFEF